jgi:hypothetical protein
MVWARRAPGRGRQGQRPGAGAGPAAALGAAALILIMAGFGSGPRLGDFRLPFWKPTVLQTAPFNP